MAIVIHSHIPASPDEIEENQSFRFTLPFFPWYRFHIKGLPLTEFYRTDRLFRLSVFYELNKSVTKEKLLESINQGLLEEQRVDHIVEMIDLIHERLIPLPLWVSVLMILFHNLRFWRYPRKWVASTKAVLRENLDIGDLAEFSNLFMRYCIEVKKKLETILQMRTETDLEGSKKQTISLPSEYKDAAKVFLSAGQQIFGRRKG